MSDSASRMRTDDLESAFTICRAILTDSKEVSVECWSFCEINNVTVYKDVNQMIHPIRITKVQNSSGMSYRLQDLQREVLTVSVVSSPFVFRYKTLSNRQNFGRS